MAREYRDSGIEWIGQIPKEWECTCFKRFHNDANVGESIDKNFCTDNENDALFYTAGLKPIHTTYKDFPTWKYTSINDLLLARNGTPYVYLPLPESIYSDHIIRVCIKENYIREYARYCIQQAISFVVVDTVSIATWSISLWDKQFLPIPSLHEQQKIADYLDKVCGEVDEMVTIQETMIEELKAYKQSVITEAVTKGLNPNAPMRNSGIDWIGNIPKHWQMKRLKFMCEIQTGNQDTQDAEQDGEYPFYVRSPKVEHSNKYSFEGEGILMAGDGAGAGRVFHHAFGKYAVHQRVYRLSSFDDIDTTFLFHYISNLFCKVMDMGSAQSTVPSVRLPMLQNFVVCIPSIEEQQHIATYLDTKCSEIDSLIVLKHAKIEELKEYKKSIIYEYVTGKKEVV